MFSLTLPVATRGNIFAKKLHPRNCFQDSQTREGGNNIPAAMFPIVCPGSIGLGDKCKKYE